MNSIYGLFYVKIAKTVPAYLQIQILILRMEFSEENLMREISFKTSRSGGKGGQNVSKVASKVEFKLNIIKSELFNDKIKRILLEKLSNKINSQVVLQIITEKGIGLY